jgi:alpha/beta hydrolase family protein
MRLLRPAAVLGLLVSFAFAGVAQASVRNPLVQGPIEGGVRGYPWNHSLFTLMGPGYAYTENEYFFGGTATDLSTGASAPYESRMLVRLPRNPKKFSGTVIVEWLNVTGQMDLETAWPVEARWLMRHGIGYVGVSAQLAGVCCGPTTLKGWDPVRYAPLSMPPGDQLSYDIVSQAIRSLRDPQGNQTSSGEPVKVDPMLGMHVRHMVLTGASQSALYLTTFVNDHYNRGQVNAYVITRGGGPFADFSTPIFQLNEENSLAQQPDNRHYMVWEEAGTAHAPAAWENDYVWPEQQRDLFGPGVPNAINAACSVNHGATDYSSRAFSYSVSRYLTTGKMPPARVHAPRIKTDSAGNVVRDSNGLAEGGLRHVFVQVPVAYEAATGCPLFGTYTQWSAPKIRSLYPTHAIYYRKVRAWSAYEVRRGWLLPQDRAEVLRKARGFTGPWTGGDTAPPQGL